MESQPQNPEFRINPENFHQCSVVGNNLCNYGRGHGEPWSEIILNFGQMFRRCHLQKKVSDARQGMKLTDKDGKHEINLDG